MRISWIALVLSFVVFISGVIHYWYDDAFSGQEKFITSTLERGDIESSISATGTLNARTQVQVGTYVSGPIKSIEVDFNSSVKKGDLLALIDQNSYQVKTHQARAELKVAEAQQDEAQVTVNFRNTELMRQVNLANKGVGSQGNLDASRQAFEVAMAQSKLSDGNYARAESALEEARINLNYTRIISPVDGVVLARYVDVGQTVAASFQTPTLFLIAEDLGKMQVKASISESDIGQVSVGQAARFTVDAWTDQEFEGKVAQRRDAPIIDNGVVTYDVMIDVENPDGKLMPGMTATVEVITATAANVLKIPLKSLRFVPEPKDLLYPAMGTTEVHRRGDEGIIWTLNERNGKVQARLVKLGLQNGKYVEITETSLNTAERVVLSYAEE